MKVTAGQMGSGSPDGFEGGGSVIPVECVTVARNGDARNELELRAAARIGGEAAFASAEVGESKAPLVTRRTLDRLFVFMLALGFVLVIVVQPSAGSIIVVRVDVELLATGPEPAP